MLLYTLYNKRTVLKKNYWVEIIVAVHNHEYTTRCVLYTRPLKLCDWRKNIPNSQPRELGCLASGFIDLLFLFSIIYGGNFYHLFYFLN